MTTTARERTTVAPLRWSLDSDGSSVGFTVTVHVDALLKRDADGRHRD